MPSNIIVNNMTTQHKMSVGITSAFPDVCKTPAPPAPAPVPIPYPNIGNSIMATDKVTKRVSDNKQKVVVKGSSYSLSNGDQPGVALGVISNKIMGKSEIKNQSFNVKFEKKGVGRLKDPHGNNSGSKPNTFAPMEGQAPAVGMTADEQKAACDALKKNRVKRGDQDKVAQKHGMTPEDAKAFRETCQRTGMSSTVRASNPACLSKINKGFPTKPGGGMGDSISDVKNLPTQCKGLCGEVSKNGKFKGVYCNGPDGKSKLLSSKEIHAADKLAKEGKLGQSLTSWLKQKGAYTGDYDLHDIFDKSGKRVRDPLAHKRSKEKKFIDSVNNAIGKTDASRMVQHGPQANVHEHLMHNDKKADELRKAFNEDKFKRIQKPDVLREPPKPLLHFDNNGYMYEINNEQDLKNLYACKGAEYPEHWSDPSKSVPYKKPKKPKKPKK